MSNKVEFTKKVVFQQDIDGQDNSVASSFISDFSEAVDDRVYSLLTAGANITITYNDSINKLVISSSGGSGSVGDADTLDGQDGTYYLDWANFINKPTLFPPNTHTHATSDIVGFGEAIDDKVYGLLVAGSNITLNYNDTNNTLTISSSGIAENVNAENVVGLSEAIDDRVYSLVVAGSNISIQYNDTANTLTINSLGGADAATLDGQDGSYYLDWTNFTNVPATFPPSSHTHTSSAITDFNYSVYSSLVAGSNIALTYNTITGKTTVTALGGTDAATLDGQDGSYYLDWTNFTNIPATFPPSSHTHTASAITDFNTAVDNEIFSYVIQPTMFAAYTHNQTASTITDFSEAVDDKVYSLFVAGSNITLSYNDSSNTFTISSTAISSVSAGDVVGLSEAIDDRAYSLFVAGTNITLNYDDSANTFTINSKSDSAILSNLAAYPDLGNYGRWFEVDSTDLWGDGRIPFSITINKPDGWFNVPTAIYPLNASGFPAVKTNFTRRYKISMQLSGTARAVYLASDPSWNNGYTTGYFWLMLYDVATSSTYYSTPVGTFDDENKYLKLFTVDLPSDIDLTKKYQIKIGIYWDSSSATWPASNQGGDTIPNNYNNYGQDCALEIHTMNLVAYDVMPSS